MRACLPIGFGFGGQNYVLNVRTVQNVIDVKDQMKFKVLLIVEPQL